MLSKAHKESCVEEIEDIWEGEGGFGKRGWFPSMRCFDTGYLSISKLCGSISDVQPVQVNLRQKKACASLLPAPAPALPALRFPRQGPAFDGFRCKSFWVPPPHWFGFSFKHSWTRFWCYTFQILPKVLFILSYLKSAHWYAQRGCAVLFKGHVESKSPKLPSTGVYSSTTIQDQPQNAKLQAFFFSTKSLAFDSLYNSCSPPGTPKTNLPLEERISINPNLVYRSCRWKA